MKLEIRERDRRALLLLIGASVLYFFITMVALPAFDRLTVGSDSVTEKEQVLRKYRRALVRKGHYTQLLEQARNNVNEAEARLIPGSNQSLASVELQRVVEEAARKAMIELTQRNISPAKKKDDFFFEITMTVSFDCTPNQLTTFLSELRNVQRFVTVTSAQITPIQVIHEAPKSGEFHKIERVNLNLAAILSAGAASAAGPVKG
jgi:hypothetical protein